MPDPAINCAIAIGDALVAATLFIAEIQDTDNPNESGLAALNRLMQAQLKLQEKLAALTLAEKAYLEELNALQSDASPSWN